MNSLTPKPTTSAIALPDSDDPYGEIAMEGGGQFGKILKYVKGRWSHSDNEIALGTEFTALIPEAARGDVRFQDGKPVEQRLGLIREHAKHARREDLGFTDESQWQMDRKGNPIDPWSPQTYLPMLHVESGDLYCYIFNSHGGKQTFRDLCRAYSPYRKTPMLPVVSLQTDKYDHPEYSWTDIPILKIERWEDSGSPPESTPAPDSDGGADAKVVGEHKVKEDPISTGRPRRNSDMDDDIPFSPEWR